MTHKLWHYRICSTTYLKLLNDLYKIIPHNMCLELTIFYHWYWFIFKMFLFLLLKRLPQFCYKVLHGVIAESNITINYKNLWFQNVLNLHISTKNLSQLLWEEHPKLWVLAKILKNEFWQMTVTRNNYFKWRLMQMYEHLSIL